MFLEENSENQVFNAKNQVTNKKPSDHSQMWNYFLTKFWFDRVPFMAKKFNDLIDQE